MYKRKPLTREQKDKNETPEEKQKRYEGQLDWSRRNPDKIKEYTKKNSKRRAEISMEWARNNKDKIRIHYKKWQENNKETVSRINKKWRDNNKEVNLKRKRESQKFKRETDPIFKFNQNTRLLISTSFRRKSVNQKKTTRTELILGCSIEFFRNYILSLCPERVTLKDFGKYGYHIDHIIPISLAKTEEEVIKLCHYTNFQPLWWEENLQKSNKIIEKNV